MSRCVTAFRALQVDRQEVEIAVPPGALEGVLWLETESFGILSEPAPVVLTSNADIADEVQSLKDVSVVRKLGVRDVESLVVDIGMVLQYAGHLTATETGTRSGTPLALSQFQMSREAGTPLVFQDFELCFPSEAGVWLYSIDVLALSRAKH